MYIDAAPYLILRQILSLLPQGAAVVPCFSNEDQKSLDLPMRHHHLCVDSIMITSGKIISTPSLRYPREDYGQESLIGSPRIRELGHQLYQ